MVEFKTKKRRRISDVEIFKEDMELARKFAKKIYKELGGLIQALILFGSSARAKNVDRRDIDILIVIDDVRINLSRDVVETYRIIVAKAIADIDKDRLHVQSMKLTSFWEYVRAGDPIAVNILRDGVALIDTGFFDPLQALLDEGRIRPSKEAIWTYFVMAPASLSRAEQHLLTGMVDLYWAAIDSAHAALMTLGETPPTPSEVADILEEKMVRTGLIEKKYVAIMRKLYTMSKKIVHREVKDYSGREYDKYKKLSEMFVKRMQRYIERKK